MYIHRHYPSLLVPKKKPFFGLVAGHACTHRDRALLLHPRYPRNLIRLADCLRIAMGPDDMRDFGIANVTNLVCKGSDPTYNMKVHQPILGGVASSTTSGCSVGSL